MPFDGNGVYSLPTNSFAQPVTDTAINSTDATATWADFVTAFSACVVDGETPSPTLISPIVNEILDANSNELLEFGTTAAAVNNLKIFNRDTGSVPYIKVQGEANTGTAIVDSNGVDILDYTATASAVNWLDIANEATGNAPTITAVSDGTDANVDIDLVPLGTGIATIDTVAIQRIQRETAEATTSGTEVEWTSIPSWVKKITLMLDDVTETASSGGYLTVQIGDAGGYETTNYSSVASYIYSAGSNGVDELTTAFMVTPDAVAGVKLYSGNIVFTNVTGNVWSMSGSASDSTVPMAYTCAGNKELSATLDRIKLIMVDNTMNGGQANVLLEG